MSRALRARPRALQRDENVETCEVCRERRGGGGATRPTAIGCTPPSLTDKQAEIALGVGTNPAHGSASKFGLVGRTLWLGVGRTRGRVQSFLH